MIRGVLLTIASLFTLQLQAQPSVATGGVLNVASYTYPGLPGGSIAQGSMFVVFGSNLGTTSSGALSFPLPKTLDNTSIKVTSGSTSVDAIMIYTTPGQVAAILPSNTPTGAATLTLTNNNQASAPVDIQVVASSFGSFTQNQGGSGPAVIQNYVSQTELPVNTITTPATPGQTVILWGTGLGPITGDDAQAPTPTNMQSALNVNVWVGKSLATVTYAGRSGCCSAIDQVDFVVPQGVEGCYLPVSVEAGGVISNFTSMAVESTSGAGCSDADGIDSADISKLQSTGSLKLGAVGLTHIALNLAIGQLKINAFSDVATASFGTYTASQFDAALGATQSPSVGSCTVSQFLGLNPLPVDPIRPAALDAGSSLSINGSPGSAKIASVSTGLYSATLGGVPLDQILTATPTPAYFTPGSYTLSGTGGAQVGAFSQPVTVPTDVTWTNSSSITTVDRTKDLTVTWSGGSATDFTVISALGVVGGPLGPSATSPGKAILCVAPASAATFTIPSWTLQALPPSTQPGAKASAIPDSFVLVGTQTPATKFSASGLDDGYVTYRSLSGNNITLQ